MHPLDMYDPVIRFKFQILAGKRESMAFAIRPLVTHHTSNAGLETAREMIPAAMAVEQEALRIDPFLPEAHALLGVCFGEYEYDWRKAERHWR
jgi:hypothetical protein